MHALADLAEPGHELALDQRVDVLVGRVRLDGRHGSSAAAIASASAAGTMPWRASMRTCACEARTS